MDSSTLFSVAPTFPVDDTRLRELRWKRILSSPVTIGAVVLAGALCFGLGAGLMGFMALYAGAALGMRSYWEKNRSKLDAACLKELIEESNEALLERLEARQAPPSRSAQRVPNVSVSGSAGAAVQYALGQVGAQGRPLAQYGDRVALQRTLLIA